MSHRNLLFLMSDQQRSDTVGAGSPCRTPHLDSLAAEGASFGRCYATNAVCSPSRASLMTGLLPHAHGMVDVAHAVEPHRANLKPDLPFWSKRLQLAGYRTAYFGKWHVERSERLEDFGFDTYELVDPNGSEGYAAYRRGLGLPETREVSEPRWLRQPGYRDWLIHGVVDEPAEASMEAYLYSRAIEFVEHAPDDARPWAVFVSTEGPHDPYVVPRASLERYDPQDLPRPASFDDPLLDRPGIYRRIQRVFGELEAPDFADATACYYAFCSHIDDQVGRILTTLRETGQEEATIVAFTSDHGDYLGAHRLLLKGVAAFEEAYKVPLVLKGPGVTAGRSIDRVVSLLDLAPTLVELTIGGDFPCHGRSLVPLLEGDAPTWNDEAFAEFHGQRFAYTQRTLWRDQHKYVFNTFDEDELYDLADDPHEMRNRARDQVMRPVLEAMAARMWEIVRETDDRSLLESQYGVLRYAPVGPEAAD
jgi:arylsulfatase A-like enzyme